MSENDQSATPRTEPKRAPRPPLQAALPFQVVDLVSGLVCLEVTRGVNGPVLRLYDDKGRVAVELSAHPHEGGRTEVFNPAGNSCAAMWASKHGGVVTARGGSDAPEVPSASLLADGEGADLELSMHGTEFNMLRVGH